MGKVMVDLTDVVRGVARALDCYSPGRDGYTKPDRVWGACMDVLGASETMTDRARDALTCSEMAEAIWCRLTGVDAPGQSTE